MQVRLVDGARLVDLTISVHDHTATVADLLDALGHERMSDCLGDRNTSIRNVVIDGRIAALGCRLDRTGLGNGSVIAIDPPEVPDAALTLTVTSGFDVGRRATVPVGRWVLGHPGPRWRARPPVLVAIEDPRLAAAHAGLEVAGPTGGVIVALGPGTVTPADTSAEAAATTTSRWQRLARRLHLRRSRPSNRRALPGWARSDVSATPPPRAVAAAAGTRVLLGPVEVAFSHPSPTPEAPPLAAGSSTRPLHRRPRPAQPADPLPVHLPAPPATHPVVTPVGVLGVVASIAMGAVMVVLFHSWAYAAFALLGPVLLVANGLDGRRRRRRARRRGNRQRQRDLTRLDADLVTAADTERRRRARLHPGPVDLLHRCTGAIPTCWDRRATDADAFAVRLGTGVGPWAPPLPATATERPDDVAEVLARHDTIEDIAIGCRLDPASPVAIVGPRTAALALARSMVAQATVDHGPVDLRVAVCTDIERLDDWWWTTWLPHARADDGESLLAAHAVAADALAARLLSPIPGNSPRRTVVLIDDPAGLAARRSGARAILRAAADPDRLLIPVVLVGDAVDVPAVCTLVLGVDDHGCLTGPPWVTGGLAQLIGMGRCTAAEVARLLTRLDDPEVDDTCGSLPGEVSLAALLPFDPYDAHDLASAWTHAGTDPPPVATIGQASDGPLVIDLAADGPHALVAGTTGSGKSELLRTLVTSLALTSSPAHVTFMLIDFKGGSAFDACARLPHTTGIVTDLDGHLAGRALRCLEAELRHRERRLREVGAPDLAAFRAAAANGDPLPRLVVVVDEFATLAAELPDFVDALVGIAQRGRSLGVHLVLATQRPAGAVSDHIRANTGLRIALRVHDGADSRDVIDAPTAAELPRHRPGRAVARLGPGELVGFQAARVTGFTGNLGPVTVALPSFGPPPPSGRSAGGQLGALPPATATDLERMTDAAAKAWVEIGGAPPRRPWPDPLPDVVDVHHPLLTRDGRSSALVLGLADDPDHQRHLAFSWDPDAGPLLAVGIPGSGTTTLAAGAVLAAARRWSADDLHVHVIDLGNGGLRPLASLPHVGAVVAGDDRERQRRLLAEVAGDLAERRAATPAGAADRPRRLLVIDGLPGLRAAWDDIEPTGTWSNLLTLLAHGPAAGIAVLLTAPGIHGVPHQVLAACHQRLAFRLADRSDHGALGISPATVPSLRPGRAIAADGERLVQITWPGADLRSAVDEQRRQAEGPSTASTIRPPDPVAVLPDELTWDDVAGQRSRLAPDGYIALAVGLTDEGLAPAWLDLPPGGAALVVGPPRSGRTTALRALAVAARATPEIAVVVVASRANEWPTGLGLLVPPDHPDLAAYLASLDRAGSPVLVLVDDADQTAEDHPVLAPMLARRAAARWVVAAARSDRLRGAYGHWLREAQADRTGLLLHPDLDLDGDLLGIRLPRRPSLSLRAGRGWLTDRDPARLCQIVGSTGTRNH